MNHQVFVLVFLLIFSLALLCAQSFPYHGLVQSGPAAKVRTTLHRLLKPRTPDDCPACRLFCTNSSGVGPGDSCLCVPGARAFATGEPPSGSTPKAMPVLISSASTSAILTLTSMRWSGTASMGPAPPIQTFRGPACRTTFSARRDTPLYRLKPPSYQVAVVLSAAFRRARPFRGFAGVRLSTSHHHDVADSCRGTCSDLA
jgi:hypothetical protein